MDNARIPYGRMKMSHLWADTPDELREMADALGLARWIQKVGKPEEHLDVSIGKREEAIERGAIPASSREWVYSVRRKRDATKNNP